MHLKNGRSAGNGAYARKGTTSKVMVASRLKVSFWPDGSTTAVNYGYMWYLHGVVLNYLSTRASPFFICTLSLKSSSPAKETDIYFNSTWKCCVSILVPVRNHCDKRVCCPYSSLSLLSWAKTVELNDLQDQSEWRFGTH
jgi:hypothetical protein